MGTLARRRAWIGFLEFQPCRVAMYLSFWLLLVSLAFAVGRGAATCSDDKPTVRGVFCLNVKGLISCRRDSDCPKGFDDLKTQEKYSYSCHEYENDSVCFEESQPLSCSRTCGFAAEPLTKASAAAKQSLRTLSEKLASKSGCPKETPCRYKNGQCGSLVGLGRRGKKVGCPKKPNRRRG